MKLVQIKTARELKLPGTSVEFVTEGDTLKEIIFRPEGEEESFSIRKGGTYTDEIKVFIRREYEVVERWRLSGTIHGVNVQQDFDKESEALSKLSNLTAQGGSLGVNPVKVRVDEAGEPLKDAPNDDIPF